MTEVIVWSGAAGGLAVGLYTLFQLWLTGKPLGVSTGYGNVCAIASDRPYFRSAAFRDPLNWRLWFLLGLPLGGVLASMTSPGAWQASWSLGALYDSAMPTSELARAGLVFVGGAAMGLGARLAGGCTSGHAIAGLSLRNPPSLMAAALFFVGGIVSVQTLFALGG